MKIFQVIIFIYYFFIACNDSTKVVKWILPDNFRGNVLILYDNPSGVIEMDIQKDTLEIFIPKTGILSIKNDIELRNFKSMFIFNSNKEELFTRGSINNSEKDIYIDSFNYISKTRKFDLDTNKLLYETPRGLSFIVLDYDLVDELDSLHKNIENLIIHHLFPKDD